MRTRHRPTSPTTFHLMGIDVAVLADADDTSGAWEAIHQTVAPGAGSPLHTLGADKLFVVLEGELTLVVDGEEHPSGAGATATVPAGVPHRFENRSDRPGRLLVVTSGAGHVDFLAGLAQLAAGGRPTPEAMAAHAARYDVQILPAAAPVP